MNSAVKSVCGWSYISSGEPSCSMRPLLRSRMRSDIAIASVWSWVTTTADSPRRTISSRSQARASSRSFASRFDSGSSISTTGGLYTSARAIATRCCWPPESWCGRRFARLPRPRFCRACVTRDSMSARRGGAQAQSVGDVVEHGAVGPQRVRLEHETQVALFDRQVDAALAVVEHVVADRDAAARGLLEARDRAQQGGLAAARGTEQRHHLSRREAHRHALQDRVVAVLQVQVLNDEIIHAGALRSAARRQGPRPPARC